ncbi:MAG: class I SAM-dependent methyltransferase [Planctomycetota bacterium]|jgi:SAM-dependent methyltransferase
MPENDDKPIAYEAYEALAGSYAARVDEKPENAFLERPATLSLLPDLDGLRVLDCGCGPGVYAELMLGRGAEVVALDASPKMLEHARKRTGGKAELHLADMGKPLDFLAAGSFDLVLCALSLDYVGDWEKTFGEFYRILKKGGLLVFSSEHPMMKFRFADTDDYFKAGVTEVAWKGFDVEVDMLSYYRPLCGMFDALWKSGFVVERFLEPRPTGEFRERDARTYEKLRRFPGFLCIRARKIPK